jgi:anti-sigma factor RsiW
MDHTETQLELEALVRGELDAERRAALDRHLRDCAECRQDLAREQKLARAFAAARVAVAPGFAARVLASLPQPRWATRRRPTAWLWPIAALLVFGVGVIGFAAGGESFGPVGSILRSTGDFLAATTLAGAGLMGATWKGVGIAVRGALGGIGGGLWVLAGVWALGVVGLYRFLLRPRWARQAERAQRRARGTRGR